MRHSRRGALRCGSATISVSSSPTDSSKKRSGPRPSRHLARPTALVSILQFAENLTDRQATHAVRSRIDVKYLLGLELADPGFDFTVLPGDMAKADGRVARGRLACLTPVWTSRLPRLTVCGACTATRHAPTLAAYLAADVTAYRPWRRRRRGSPGGPGREQPQQFPACLRLHRCHPRSLCH
ncbi:transposase [Streptomyces aureus]|uniref:Transposase n=1 Tax=Streptomyces aureus TaxID=193461 RepID=A0ABV4SXM7_9ACTN